jgi:hypothetical protein
MAVNEDLHQPQPGGQGHWLQNDGNTRLTPSEIVALTYRPESRANSVLFNDHAPRPPRRAE